MGRNASIILTSRKGEQDITDQYLFKGRKQIMHYALESWNYIFR